MGERERPGNKKSTRRYGEVQSFSQGEGYDDPAAQKGGPGDEEAHPVIEKVEFAELVPREKIDRELVDIEAFKEIPLRVSAELGSSQLKVRDLISLEKGSLLKLKRLTDENIEVLVNETPFARGEVVVINDRFGVRLISFEGGGEESDPESG